MIPTLVPGEFNSWYVNATRCLGVDVCGLCVVAAPNNITTKVPTQQADVFRQPLTYVEDTDCFRASEVCPVHCIHNGNTDFIPNPEQ
jgi:ferredoxin